MTEVPAKASDLVRKTATIARVGRAKQAAPASADR
jgi:hypothetical protein